jgi:hypothetical protein
VSICGSEKRCNAICGFSDVDLTVLATTLDKDLSKYVGHDVELFPSRAASPAAVAPRMTCLQAPTPDALTRPSDTKGHVQRGISRIVKARVFLDLLAFCGPSPLNYLSIVLGTDHGALAMVFASHESSFRGSSNYYIMAAYRVLCLTSGHAFHVRKYP